MHIWHSRSSSCDFVCLVTGYGKKGIPKSSLPFPFFQESFCVKLGRLPEASKASSYRALLCRAVEMSENPGEGASSNVVGIIYSLVSDRVK